MDIDEIREKRAKLVDDIQNLLVEFYSETGVIVTDIRVDDDPILVEVKTGKMGHYCPRIFLEVRL